MKRFDVEKLDGTGRVQIEAKTLEHAKEKAAKEIYGHAKVRYTAGVWHEYGQTLTLVDQTVKTLLEAPSDRPKVTSEEAKDLEIIQKEIEGAFDREDANITLENLRKNRQYVFRCIRDVVRDDHDGKITGSRYGAFMGLMKKHTEGIGQFFEVIAS